MQHETSSERNPRLAAMDGPLRGHVIELDREPWSIGRGRTNRLVLEDPSVSRQHCVIECREGVFHLRDLDSHNGTFVNGLPVHDHVLAEGDAIKAGHSVFRFATADSGVQAELESVRFESDRLEHPTVLMVRSQDSVYLKAGEILASPADAQKAAKGYEALLRVTAALHASRGPEGLALELLRALLESMPAERAALLLMRAGEREPLLACSRDRTEGDGAPVEVSRTAVERAFREGLALLSGSTDAAGGRQWLAAPLFSGPNTLGVIYLDADARAGLLGADDLQLAAAVGVMAGPAVEDALEFSRMEDENRRLGEEIRLHHEMVGQSEAMEEVLHVIARAAPTDSTVLILGETGTGKELAARALHQNSHRAKGPFVAINCAALTETLLESELFGHERGAFTGAVAQKKGKLEAADHGTVFLDEIGELTPALQSKLLRVLQERQFERVGGTRSIGVDVRVIAATNRDLRTAVAEKTFRDDLYYRLNVVTLRLPPLRDRREDIPLLANYFLAQRAGAGARRVCGISDRARTCLTSYEWPGNIRELEHAIESALVLGSGTFIEPEDLPEAVLDGAPSASLGEEGYHQRVREQKGDAILAALEQARGNVTEAARILKLNPNYLHRLIRNLGLRDRMAKIRA
jgi:transcriptional regulator with GAF, ATPase, and Fis domain